MSTELWSTTGDYAYAYGRAFRVAAIVLEDLRAGRSVDVDFVSEHLADIAADLGTTDEVSA